MNEEKPQDADGEVSEDELKKVSGGAEDDKGYPEGIPEGYYAWPDPKVPGSYYLSRRPYREMK